MNEQEIIAKTENHIRAILHKESTKHDWWHYEKLLLLKDHINTKIDKVIAEPNHHLVDDFLKQFKAEWFWYQKTKLYQVGMPQLISQHNINSFPKLKRYWNILENLEKEFAFDPEGLWSYTPQFLAEKIAAHTPGNHIIDLFCGVGGNAIGFAKTGKQVEAIDNCSDRLVMAKHNASRMDVSNKINFHHQDARSFISALTSIDTVFIDPPWGGERHRQLGQFCFDHFLWDIKGFLRQCFEISEHVILKLPFNFNTSELRSFNRDVEVVNYYLPEYEQDRPFFIVAYF